MIYTVDRAPPARPELESKPKRALRWIEVPVAYALISALAAHSLLHFLPVSEQTTAAGDCPADGCYAFPVFGHLSTDAMVSTAAIAALLTVAAYRAWLSFRGR